MSETTSRIWRVANVVRRLGDSDEQVLATACERVGVTVADVASWRVLRRSLDARGRRAPSYVLQVELVLGPGVDPVEAAHGSARRWEAPVAKSVPRAARPDRRPIIIGSGPCGLFAALRMVEAGLRPILIERGKPVETRAKDVAALMGRGTINEDSNLCFGEGGAGTWSDGKLYTRIGRDHIPYVLDTFVRMGGPQRILVDSRPHLGTDRLVAILKAFRALLVDAGCEVIFNAAVTKLNVSDGRCTGVTLRDGQRIDGDGVILATGHSARDLYRELAAGGVAMEATGFAVGFRVEHPQQLINEAQYGEWSEHEELPAAIYEVKADGPRPGYSFCMCPGGSVVPTPTREGEVCVNGMSHSARSGHYANSAIVTTVSPADVARWVGGDPLLAGLRFQERCERAAWELGGGAFVAPAQKLTDYLTGAVATTLRRTTYKRGVTSTSLDGCYPDEVHEALKAALSRFDRQVRGFVTDEAVLIGVETRTSAPVRILRDSESCQSESLRDLYPAGEGAGFAGGIVSAAVDGIRVADALMASSE